MAEESHTEQAWGIPRTEYFEEIMEPPLEELQRRVDALFREAEDLMVYYPEIYEQIVWAYEYREYMTRRYQQGTIPERVYRTALKTLQIRLRSIVWRYEKRLSGLPEHRVAPPTWGTGGW
ncbi:MAG: hypothetical protein DRO11_01250 [Methanobacteriota archaeon]|nr:MAG: hypothetical protein DRO11_01250 [Euryarchaeota archaeon]